MSSPAKSLLSFHLLYEATLTDCPANQDTDRPEVTTASMGYQITNSPNRDDLEKLMSKVNQLLHENRILEALHITLHLHSDDAYESIREACVRYCINTDRDPATMMALAILTIPR